MVETRSLTEEKKASVQSQNQLPPKSAVVFPRIQQNSEIQQTEIRNVLLGGHGEDDTETEVVVPEVGRVHEAVGRARKVQAAVP